MKNFQEIFTDIYQHNRWGGTESKSGPGSSLLATNSFREGLLMIIQKYKIESIVDCACGDWNWMKEIKEHLPKYLGIDIVANLIKINQEKYQTEKIKFIHGNMLEIDQLIDQTDLIIVRHVLEHHKTEDILLFLEKVKKITKYALITSNNIEKNIRQLDKVGGSRGINLEIAPFELSNPLEKILDVADISKWDGIHGVFGYLYKFNENIA